jgi:hypothetical protein
MHGKLIMTALIGGALTGPAFAQGSGTAPGSQGTGPQAQQQPGQSRGQSQGQSQSQSQAMSQQQLRRQLEQAGFREVQILDAAYLVQARTQEGNTVFMMINPPGSGTSASGMSSGQSSGSSASGSGASGSGSPSGSGGSSSPSR